MTPAGELVSEVSERDAALLPNEGSTEINRASPSPPTRRSAETQT